MTTSTATGSRSMPVTPAQLAMLVHSSPGTDSTTYGVVNVVQVDEELPAASVAAAWRAVIAEYAALRSRFEYGPDERWRMVIHDGPVDEQVTLRTWDRDRPPSDDSLRQLVRDRAASAAAPGRPATVEVYAAERPYIVWSHHHAILDGWSKATILDRVLLHARWLAGSAPAPPPVRDELPALQAQLLEAADDGASRAFWHDRLHGVPPSLLGQALSAGPGMHELEMPIDDHTWRAATATARALGATVPTVFAAAFATALTACLRRADVAFGVVTSLRGIVAAADEHVVGLCLNTLPLRVRLRMDQPWTDLLPTIHQDLGALWQHGAIPVTSLAEAAGRPISQVVDTLLVFQNYPGASARFLGQGEDGRGGLRTTHLRDNTNYTLAINVQPTGEHRWGMRVTFAGDRVTEATARGFAECFRTVLGDIADHPQRRAGDTPLALPEPDDAVPMPPASDVLQRFYRTASRTPDAIAVSGTHAQLSYAELLQRGTDLAATLVAAGVRAGDAVGLLVDHQGEAVIGAVAALRIGAYYVPLDPQWSVPHLRSVIGSLAMTVVVTVEETAGPVDQLPVRAVRADVVHPPVDAAPGVLEPDHLPPGLPAVALFTSGTSGMAKGVALTRAGLGAMVQATADLDAGPVSTVRFSRLAFDMSSLDVWTPLATGGRCVFPHVRTPPPDVFAEYLQAHRPDLVVLPPGYFNLCVDERPDLFADVRQVLVGGEAPSARHAVDAQARHSHLAVTNIYGPTETTTYVTCGDVRPAQGGGGVDVGRALQSVRLVVVDPWLRPVPPGLPGEICVRGPQVGLGYVGATSATAAAFVPDVTGPPGARMYRTGDLGYLDMDGRYRLLGRLDRQVKVRGHRVEPAGIEAGLRTDPRVLDAAVIARGGADGRVVAFVVPADPDADPAAMEAAIRAALRAHLPDYLHPDRIIGRPAIPRTANGKVDTAVLWAEARAAKPTLVREPGVDLASPVANTTATVWRDVLGRPFVADEDFLAVGGNSLTAMRLTMRLHQLLGVHLSVRELFAIGSGRELVRRVEELVAREATA